MARRGTPAGANKRELVCLQEVSKTIGMKSMLSARLPNNILVLRESNPTGIARLCLIRQGFEKIIRSHNRKYRLWIVFSPVGLDHNDDFPHSFCTPSVHEVYCFVSIDLGHVVDCEGKVEFIAYARKYGLSFAL